MRPAKIKRTPAKFTGVVKGRPNLIPTKAVDHKKQATIARVISFDFLFTTTSQSTGPEERLLL